MPVLSASRPRTSSSTSPATSGGEHYTPLPQKKEGGYVYAHAVQTILADSETLYKLWSDVASIPLWQEQVVSVTPQPDDQSERVSHWVMGNPEDPDGKRVEFDSEVYESTPGSRIAWRSIAGDVEQTGEVNFVPVQKGELTGTRVTLMQTVKVPGGVVGNAAAAVAKRSPQQTVIENLRHFKELVESGEIPSVKGQPHGPRGVTGGIKEWALGETNPTPPGTSTQS